MNVLFCQRGTMENPAQAWGASVRPSCWRCMQMEHAEHLRTLKTFVSLLLMSSVAKKVTIACRIFVLMPPHAALSQHKPSHCQSSAQLDTSPPG